MRLDEKYAPSSASEDEKKDKKVIGDDAFAICEFLEKLMGQIRRSKL